MGRMAESSGSNNNDKKMGRMAESSGSNNNDKKMGISGGFLALILTVAFVGIMHYALTEYNLYHQWYWLGGALGATCGIFVVSFLMKGAMAKSINGILFGAVCVCLMLSYWFSTYRISVMADRTSALKAIDADPGTALKKLFETTPRAVIVFLGKRNPNASKLPKSGKDAQLNVDEIVKDFAKLLEDHKKAGKDKDNSDATVKNGNITISSQEDADAMTKALNKMRFTDLFSQGTFQFEKPLSDVLDEKYGMSLDDFKKKYAKAEIRKISKV